MRIKRLGTIAISGLFTLLVGLGFQTAHAEGSRSLYPSGISGSRANLDLQPGNRYVGKVHRVTFLYVYAQAGEYILLGSSNRSGSGDILVYNPQSFGIPGDETIPATADFSCADPTPPAGSYSGGALGVINSRDKELAGPNSADNSVTVTNGFAPCAYLATQTGIHGVQFTVNSSGGGPTGTVASITTSSNSVAAWDVSVRGSANATTDLNGRVFTYAWNGFTGGNSRPVYSTHYYVTADGYRYSQQLRGLDPNGFALYANSLGFLDNGQPLYKDLRGAEALVTSLPIGVTTQIAQFPLFFSDIAPTTAHAAEVDRVLEALGIPTAPATPTVANVSFTGPVSGNRSTTGAGGTFRFSTTDTVTYMIVVSRDGIDFSPQNTGNVVLTGIATTGTHVIEWNGRDTSGAVFPSNPDDGYKFRVFGRAGEVHFPIIDAENNDGGGPTVTRLNGPAPSNDTTVYFDDRGYITNSGTLVGNLNGTLCNGATPAAPNPQVRLDGVDSTTSYRAWQSGTNANSDCAASAGWGDAKALNLWTYYSTSHEENELFIDPVTYDGATSVSAPISAVPGSTVQGTFTFGNNGTGSVTGVTYGMTIGTGCSTPAVTFANLPVGVSASCSGAGEYAFIGLPATLGSGEYIAGSNPNAPITFSYTAPASGTVTATTTIAIAEADEYAGNDSDSVTTGFGANEVRTLVSVPATASAGSTVLGTFQFANIGGGAATDWTYSAVIGAPGACPAGVSFPGLPAGVTLASYNTSTCAATFNGLPSSLAAGQSFDFTFSYTAPGSGATIPVNTTINATGDGNSANNAANGETTVVVPLPDVYAEISAPASVPAGAVVSTAVRFGNQGGAIAQGVIYIVELDPGLSGVSCAGASCSYNPATGLVTVTGLPGTLSPGQSVDFTLTYPAPTVTPDALPAAARITTTTAGETPTANNEATTITAVTGGAPALADPATTATAPATAYVGTTVVVDVRFSNDGTTGATGVTYALGGLPAGAAVSYAGSSCTVGALGALSGCALPTALPAGEGVDVVVTYPATAPGSVTVTSTIGGTSDADPANNQASVTTVVSAPPATPLADVTADVSVPATAGPGTEVVAHVRYANLGPGTASGTGYALTVSPGAGSPVVRYNGVECAFAAGVVSGCGLPTSLSPGQSVALEVIFVMPPSGVVVVTATASTSSPEVSTTNNSASGATTAATPSGGISGSVWYDGDGDNMRDAGESGRAGWTVELMQAGEVVARTTTGGDGSYAFPNLADGAYSVRFNPAPGVGRLPVNGESGASVPNGGTPGVSILSNIVVASGAMVTQQSLPVDPSGTVYDSVTRQPVSGAIVTLSATCGPIDPSWLVGGQPSVTTGADGAYAFFLTPAAPDACEYSLTVSRGGYTFVSTNLPPDGGVWPAGGGSVGTAGAPQQGDSTLYYLRGAKPSADLTNNNIPLDPAAAVAPIPSLSPSNMVLLALLIAGVMVVVRRYGWAQR